MSSRDRTLKCKSCGIRFVFSAAQQRACMDTAGSVLPPDTCPGCQALKALGGRARGIVAWYDPRKGYGFIRGDAGQDVFVHRSSIRRQGRRRLYTGDAVEYAVEQTDRGPVAREVSDLVG